MFLPLHSNNAWDNLALTRFDESQSSVACMYSTVRLSLKCLPRQSSLFQLSRSGVGKEEKLALTLSYFTAHFTSHSQPISMKEVKCFDLEASVMAAVCAVCPGPKKTSMVTCGRRRHGVHTIRYQILRDLKRHD